MTSKGERQNLRPATFTALSASAMTTVLKSTTTRKQLTALLKRTRKRKRKGVDVKSFSGTLMLKEDSLVIQKRMRDEWK